jgi:hypothetical protein
VGVLCVQIVGAADGRNYELRAPAPVAVACVRALRASLGLFSLGSSGDADRA